MCFRIYIFVHFLAHMLRCLHWHRCRHTADKISAAARPSRCKNANSPAQRMEATKRKRMREKKEQSLHISVVIVGDAVAVEQIRGVDSGVSKTRQVCVVCRHRMHWDRWVFRFASGEHNRSMDVRRMCSRDNSIRCATRTGNASERINHKKNTEVILTILPVPDQRRVGFIVPVERETHDVVPHRWSLKMKTICLHL